MSIGIENKSFGDYLVEAETSLSASKDKLNEAIASLEIAKNESESDLNVKRITHLQSRIRLWYKGIDDFIDETYTPTIVDLYDDDGNELIKDVEENDR